MNALTPWLTVLTGASLRLGLPLLITALMVWWLRRVDAQWQAEARTAQRAAAAKSLVPCWVARNCSLEQRATCAAFTRHDIPCWQLFRDERGQLKPQCLQCAIFRAAPAFASV